LRLLQDSVLEELLHQPGPVRRTPHRFKPDRRLASANQSIPFPFPFPLSLAPAPAAAGSWSARLAGGGGSAIPRALRCWCKPNGSPALGDLRSWLKGPSSDRGAIAIEARAGPGPVAGGLRRMAATGSVSKIGCQRERPAELIDLRWLGCLALPRSAGAAGCQQGQMGTVAAASGR